MKPKIKCGYCNEPLDNPHHNQKYHTDCAKFAYKLLENTWRKSSKGKRWVKKHRSTRKYRKSVKEYNSTPERKKKLFEYSHTEKAIASRKKSYLKFKNKIKRNPLLHKKILRRGIRRYRKNRYEILKEEKEIRQVWEGFSKEKQLDLISKKSKEIMNSLK